MDIYWRPHHEVHPELPPDQDLIAFDGEKDIGRVYCMQHSVRSGWWSWSMYAHSNTGRVPFLTWGVEEKRGDAGRRVVEAYRLLLAHNEHHPRRVFGKPRVELGGEKQGSDGLSRPNARIRCNRNATAWAAQCE